MFFESSLAVLINNNTGEKITNLTLTYEGIKSDITVPPVELSERIVIKIDPKEQADDSFNGASLELHYEDDTGQTYSEIVFDHFEAGYSGDAEVTITDKNNNGVFTMDVEKNIGIGGLGN